jgi:hypothetical protein
VIAFSGDRGRTASDIAVTHAILVRLCLDRVFLRGQHVSPAFSKATSSCPRCNPPLPQKNDQPYVFLYFNLFQFINDCKD